MTIRGAVGALCCAALLAGCSSEAEPRTLPPVPSASPSPVVLPVPPEATPETAEAASAFAEHYLKVIGTAFATADPEPLRALSAPGCGGCDALIASVEELQEQGRKRVGGGYLVKSVAAPPIEAGDVVVEISYEREAGQVVDASGQVFASAPAVPRTNAQMRLLRRSGSWIVQGYRVVES